MVKLDGLIIEMLIIVNFCEGLNVLQYFILIYGVCKGLVDMVLKIVNLGYLMCCFVDVMQDLVVVEDDCGMLNGVVMKVLVEGGEVVEVLCDCIFGCVVVVDVVNLEMQEMLYELGMLFDEMVVEEIECFGIDEVCVCMLLICEMCYGLCVVCYGCDFGCGLFVNVGEVVGVIVVQLIGELGMQLMMCMFYIGGVVLCVVVVLLVEVKSNGIVCFMVMMCYVMNVKGEQIVIFCLGEVMIIDDFGCECECYKVLYGVMLLQFDGVIIKVGMQFVMWDLLMCLIIIEYGGMVKFENVEEGVIVVKQIDDVIGLLMLVVIDVKCCGLQVLKSVCLQVKLFDVNGEEVKILGMEYVVQIGFQVGVLIIVKDGQQVQVGEVFVCILMEVQKMCDIIGGLLWVVELFEVCLLKDVGIFVEVIGMMLFGKDMKGKQCFVIMDFEGNQYEFLIVKEKQVLVYDVQVVNKGEMIVDGLVDLYDILCLQGIEVLLCYIVDEVQDVYCLQGVKINDKYIEVIVCQMLSCVQIIDNGDMCFILGEQVECFDMLDENDCMIVEGKCLVLYDNVLFGIMKVLLLIDLFIFVVLFQEMICVLIEVVIMGKCDDLCGLKENVIVGCLILVGMGFVFYKVCKVKELLDCECFDQIVVEEVFDFGMLSVLVEEL